ncbi:MAG: tetratricopeptide repeat protein [Sumerlaeia bacterium]
MKKAKLKRTSTSSKWELVNAPSSMAIQQGISVQLPIPVKEVRRVQSNQFHHGELARWIHKYLESAELEEAEIANYKSAMAHLQLYQDSIEALNEQDFASAMDKTTQIVTNYPADTLAKLNYAHLLLQSQKPEEAQAALNQIQETQQNNIRFIVVKSRVLEALGKRQEMVALLTAAYQSAPQNYSLIQELQRIGELIPVVFNAENLLESKFVTRSKYSQMVRDHANTLLKAKKFTELQKLVDFHLEDRKAELAEFLAEMILAKQPASVEAKVSKGIALMHQKSLEKSEVIFKEVLAKNPDHYKAHTCLARVNFDRGQVEEAVALLESIYEKEPTKTEAPELIILAQTSAENRLAKAVELAAKSPDNWVPKKLLGDLEFGLGQVEDALNKHLEVFRESDSDDALTMILHEYDKLNMMDEALKLIGEIPNLAKRNAAVRWNTANVYLKAGRLKNALNVLKDIVNDKALPHDTRFSSTVLLAEIYKNMS